jgi:mRNA interferase MazF
MSLLDRLSSRACYKVIREADSTPCSSGSPDVFNDRSGTVIAVALTSQEPRATVPLTLESSARGLPKRSWIKISQIRTLVVERIGRRMAQASPEEVAKVLGGASEESSATPDLASSLGPTLESARAPAADLVKRHSAVSIIDIGRWAARSSTTQLPAIQ